MNVHRWLDVVAQKNMWRRAMPPVESAASDMARLLDASDDELHPEVEPAGLTWSAPRRLKGAVEESFAFPSPLATGRPEVDTVRGVRWRRGVSGAPGSRGSRGSDRALVMVHGAYAGSHAKVSVYLPPLRTMEWDTFSMELPHHMRRQRPDSAYSGQFMVTADVPRLVRGMHQGEADLRALVSGLRRLGYRSIVLGGISLGGNIVLQAVLRLPVDRVVVVAPPVDAYASLWESVMGDGLRRAGNAAGVTDETARRVLSLITPVHMGRPALEARRILFVYGADDLLCPPGPIDEIRRAWGGCLGRVLGTGHATLILRFWTVRRTIAAWTRGNRRCQD